MGYLRSMRWICWTRTHVFQSLEIHFQGRTRLAARVGAVSLLRRRRGKNARVSEREGPAGMAKMLYDPPTSVLTSHEPSGLRRRRCSSGALAIRSAMLLSRMTATSGALSTGPELTRKAFTICALHGYVARTGSRRPAAQLRQSLAPTCAGENTCPAISLQLSSRKYV